MIKYEIISSGSKGNAVIIEDIILIDCGVNYKKLKDYIKNIKFILLTHEHKDHFLISTIKKMLFDKPNIRIICGDFLKEKLINEKINKNLIYTDTKIKYKDNKNEIIFEHFDLFHDVPNIGYKIYFNDKKYIYISDTNSVKNIEAKNFDLYLIEANYSEDDILENIENKIYNDQYVYEYRVLKTHLSREKAEMWLTKNAGIDSKIIFIHIHD